MKLLFVLVVLGGIIFSFSRKKKKNTKSTVHSEVPKHGSHQGGARITDNDPITTIQEKNTQF